jgi:hypothetical protein
MPDTTSSMTATIPSDREKAIAEFVSLAKAHDKAFAAAVAPIDAAAIAKGLTWPKGARVLDLVTGQKGTVLDGKRENVVLPTT